MWEKEIEIMERYVVKFKAKNKKMKRFYDKLINIDDEIKDKLLVNYMELRRSVHCIIYARWRQNQLAKEKEEYVTYQNPKLLKRMNSCLRMEDDYLNDLLKFKTAKAQCIKTDIFRGTEPGILDLDHFGRYFVVTFELYRSSKRREES